jgi:hypothetical protein
MTRLFKSVVLAGTVGMGLLSLSVTPVRADIVPVLGADDDAPSPSPSAGGFTWTYDAILHSEQKVQTGDFFTIYDFFGYTGVHSEPAGWSLTAANVTTPPPFVFPPDSTGIVNLKWIYTGMAEITTPMVGQDLDMGDFSAESTTNLATKTDFASQGTSIADGTKIGNAGWISGPAVPEPCTLALLGLGGAPLLGSLRRRSRKA